MIEKRVANQNCYISLSEKGDLWLRSYNSFVARISRGKLALGRDWNYSTTTSKHLNYFIGRFSHEIEDGQRAVLLDSNGHTNRRLLTKAIENGDLEVCF